MPATKTKPKESEAASVALTPPCLEFIISTTALKAVFTSANRAVPAKPDRPILATVLIEAIKDKREGVQLTGFDLNFGLHYFEPAIVSHPGSVAVPGKLLADILSKITDDFQLQVAVRRQESGALVMTCTTLTGEFTLNCMDGTAYPALPDIDEDPNGLEEVQPTAGLLARAMKATLDNASNEATKKVLCGLHLSTPEPGFLEMCATDGHRLTTYKFEVQGAEISPVTIPERACRELMRVLEGLPAEESILLQVAEGHLIRVKIGDRLQVVSRIISDPYPDYRRLIPAQFSTTVTCDRKVLRAVLERAEVYSQHRSLVAAMEISLTNNEITLTVAAPDCGNFRESLPAQTTTTDPNIQRDGAIRIGFNTQYLIRTLKMFDGEEVSTSINTKTGPVIWRPLTGQSHLCMVMPVDLGKST
ncbi:MAG: DNA polymerase III subunit beta [Cyanobacteria bacterium P01_H01_bin.121]